jgi:hypothetical protein
MLMVRIALIAALSLASTLSFAAPKAYEVSASIAHDGQKVATPTVLVKPSSTAEMSVTGENGFSLSVTVVPSEADAIDVFVNIGTAKAALKTTVTTLTGKPVVVASGELEVTVTVSEGDS